MLLAEMTPSASMMGLSMPVVEMVMIFLKGHPAGQHSSMVVVGMMFSTALQALVIEVNSIYGLVAQDKISIGVQD